MAVIWRVLSETYVFLRGLFRYKEILFWVILFPLLWYGLMVAIWGNPQANPVTVGVCNTDNSVNDTCMGCILVDAMNESGLFNVKMYKTTSDLEAAVSKGKVSAGLYIPSNFTSNLLSGSQGQVILYTVDTNDGHIASGYLEGFLNGFADQIRSQYINTSIEYMEKGNISMPPEYYNYTIKWLRLIENPLKIAENTYTPPLIATSAGIKAFYAIAMIGVESLFVGLFTGVSSVIERKREGSLRVLLSNPISGTEILASDIISGMVAVALASIAVFGVSLAVGARYQGLSPASVAVISLLLFIGTLFSIAVGLLIAPLARTPEGAGILANAIAWPVMFAGGLVVPREILPEWIRGFADVWPLSRLMEDVRKILIYGVSPGEALYDAVPSITATIVVLALGVLTYRKLLERAIEA